MIRLQAHESCNAAPNESHKRKTLLEDDPGDSGGQVIAQGTPEDVAENPASYTGQYLKTVLGKKKAA
ncbi:MAG: hypothetical protein IH604_20425 [Burkholderiales bacterium]|nr:hypothetical protein [Burkholderiales bacterium]